MSAPHNEISAQDQDELREEREYYRQMLPTGYRVLCELCQVGIDYGYVEGPPNPAIVRGWMKFNDFGFGMPFWFCENCASEGVDQADWYLSQTPCLA